MAVEIKQITRNIEIKTPLTPDQIKDILQKVSEAHLEIERQQEELKIARESCKSECERQDEIISQCLARYRRGYDVKTCECFAKYENGEATFTDAKTGEIVEQRAISEEEQLQLSSNRIDAEDIIRQASDEEDNEGDEE